MSTLGTTLRRFFNLYYTSYSLPRLSNTNETMPNLKVFTNELLGKLMSSLEEDQQEVRIKAFALAKRPLRRPDIRATFNF